MKKVIWLSGLLLILLIVATVAFYRSIQNDYYAENDRAAQIALAQTSLTRADHVDYFTGDDIYRIVYGVNESGDKLIVWVSEDDVHEALVSDGITRDAVRAAVKERYGKADILRIVPGKFKEDYVWEAYFAREEDGQRRFYYDYYRFTDGERLDTYQINAD